MQSLKNNAEYLHNSVMSVQIDNAFPRVISYTLAGKSLNGDISKRPYVVINGCTVHPSVTFIKNSFSKATYTLTLEVPSEYINAILTVEIEVIENTVRYRIVRIDNRNDYDRSAHTIDNPKKLIETIAFPDLFFVSVDSTHDNPRLDGARMSTATQKSGDEHYRIIHPMETMQKGYMYAFVCTSELCAGVWTNAQYSQEDNPRDVSRLQARIQTADSVTYAGIAVSPWIYQRHHNGYVPHERMLELPEVRIAVTADANNDGIVDWNDGAIAYRAIMHNPYKCGEVPELVFQRIVMNFGSQAQNPFLMTVDGIKKIALHTDGLGQAVLLKGYGSEGHDSGHLDYAGIGSRIGGLKDFKSLLEKAPKYGARIGIHINASETYPESKYFSEPLLRKKDGKYVYGWNWLDQAINIDSSYDLFHGRYERLAELKDAIGGGLDFIYVDVWGNSQSGDNGAWATHQLAKEINELGWRFAIEWSHSGEYDSTFQHWAVDLPYGGKEAKGINSAIARFIRNHQKDAWIGNYPEYGGAADFPLLGGYELKDFEGWQGRSDYRAYITTVFTTGLPTKYIQHFTVTKWVDGKPVEMSDADGTYTWTPEMEIELTNEQHDKLIITRGSNNPADTAYRSRTLTLNGRVILDGSAYLIPWNWDSAGRRLPPEKEKCYYFNTQAGETLWQLPEQWQLPALTVYELTDVGRINEMLVPVKDGVLRLHLAAGSPYVIYKEPQPPLFPAIQWSEGMHIYDAGFNSGCLDGWTIDGDASKASIVLSHGANKMLKIADNTASVALSRQLTDLQPNTQYAAYIGVDNRSDSKATLSITTEGRILSNYTKRSIAKNYVQAYAHNTLMHNATVDGESYFQNMYVFFTTGKNADSVRLTLSKEAGEGAAYFDDIRIVENNSMMYGGKHDTGDGVFTQNFEAVAQGIFPFVIGDAEGVEDNRTHLAEKHEPYTQRGWNGKKISDVISGNWSVKTNGLTGAEKIIYRTIPQNIRFEPGQDYRISFDYEAGSSGTYAVIQGDEHGIDSALTVPLDDTWRKSSHAVRYSFILKGKPSGESWFGIFSTAVKADTEVTSGADAAFRSYGDFILDNICIEKSETGCRTTH